MLKLPHNIYWSWTLGMKKTKKKKPGHPKKPVWVAPPKLAKSDLQTSKECLKHNLIHCAVPGTFTFWKPPQPCLIWNVIRNPGPFQNHSAESHPILRPHCILPGKKSATKLNMCLGPFQPPLRLNKSSHKNSVSSWEFLCIDSTCWWRKGG